MPDFDLPNTHRFFVAPTSFTASSAVRLTDSDLIHQLTRVLRLGAGDRVLLLDGLGNAYVVELQQLERNSITCSIIEQRQEATELPFTMTIYVSVLRPERFEWVLQKGTELGASRFVPVVFQRSLPADRIDDTKRARWMRIVREASEQSCRSILPHITPPQPFAHACDDAATAELPLFLWEGEARPLRATLAERTAHPASVSLMSGPVGGISEEEVKRAVERGMIPVSLGPRILRAETAPIAALAALIYQFE